MPTAPSMLTQIIEKLLLTVLFDYVGRSNFSTLWVNILGAVGIALAAYTAQWFKAKPWAKKEIKA